jgi:6-pyruvoyl-tetrahydropterin synthase
MPAEESQTKKSKNKSGTLFIRDVDKIDCAVFDPAQGILGHSWHVDVLVSGLLDKNGFVYDFSDLKTIIKQALGTTLDHSLIIPVMSKQVQFQDTKDGELWKFHTQSQLTGDRSYWEYKCPKGAVFPLRAISITDTLIERECARIIRHRLPEEILSVKVQLREELADSTAVFFRYTHGITNHKGLCQRPFHGHRSILEVHVDNKRRHDLEEYAATTLLKKSVHIASTSQLVEKKPSSKNAENVHISFKGKLGKYEASIPSNRVLLVKNRTSVEIISQHIAQHLAKKVKNGGVLKVVCYEGIGKGAISEISLDQ